MAIRAVAIAGVLSVVSGTTRRAREHAAFIDSRVAGATLR